MLYHELITHLAKLRGALEDEVKNKREQVQELIKGIEWIALERDYVSEACSVVSADSSFALFEMRVGTVYSLQGVALAYVAEGSQNASFRAHRTFCDAGFLIVDEIRESLVRRIACKRALTFYAYLNELEAAHSLARENRIGLVLLDGSLLAFLTARIPGKAKLRLMGARGERGLEDILYEKQRLAEALAQDFKPCFLAKGSALSVYAKTRMTDVELLELANVLDLKPYSRAGFAKPKVLSLSELAKFLGFEPRPPLDKATLTYIRLRDKSPLIQLTIPGELCESELEQLVKCLRFWSPVGYPIPLENAHKLSRLSRKALLEAFMKFGIPLLSGREFVEF